MNFLFVDRILECQPGQFASGVKHVTASDYYLTTGRNGSTALLSSIVGETLGQLGAWSVMAAVDFSARPVAGVASQVNIYDDAYVGDSIFLETTIDQLDESAVQYHSVAKVNDKTIFTIESALGPMLPMQDFIDPAVARNQFNLINRPGEWSALPVSQQNLHQDVKTSLAEASYDHIIDWQRGEKVVAQKNVSLLAPYFIDHFPRKPVLPLTMLLSCNIDLATQFIRDLLPAERARDFHVSELRRTKMNGFVQPGDAVITTMQLKQQTEQEIVFSFRSEVDGKRVCIVEASFTQGKNHND